MSVRELKNHLSEYLRRAQAGERIVVTSRGKAIASLSAAVDTGSRRSSDAELVRRLERLPWISPPRKGGKVTGSDRPTSVPDGTTDEIMDWVRGG